MQACPASCSILNVCKAPCHTEVLPSTLRSFPVNIVVPAVKGSAFEPLPQAFARQNKLKKEACRIIAGLLPEIEVQVGQPQH